MIRGLRVVWPPWWILLPAVLVAAGFEATFLTIEWTLGVPLFSSLDNQHGWLMLLSMFAAFYALYRVGAFHPFARPDYLEWLRGTPWTSQKPLPLGPVQLAWQDLILMALLLAVGWPRLHAHVLVVGQVFLFVYLLSLALMHFLSGAVLSAYAVGFGAGFMALFARNPMLFCEAAVITYGLARLGLRISLAAFPWEQSVGARMKQAMTPEWLGWSHDRLGPAASVAPPIPWRDTLLLGTLGGWWFLAVSWHFRGFFMDEIRYAFFLAFLFGGCAIRLMAYCMGYLPPISLLGRLAHCRPIIPGYDQVFVAPMLALLVAIIAWFITAWTGLPRLVVTPMAITLTWWILFGMGPSLRTWRLTGNHRISAGIVSNGVFTR